jgi:cell division protein FtsB
MAGSDKVVEKLFWIGKGTVKVGGKLYATGKEIPADKIDPKKVEKWLSEGLVSNAAVAIKPAAHDPKAEAKIEKLKAKIKEMKAEAKKGTGPCEECPKKDETIAALQTDNDEKAALIEKLKGEVEALKKSGKK